jgi:hypothetical protein
VERASKTYAWLAGVHTRNWNHCGNDVAWTLLVLLSLAAKILGEDDDGGEMLDEFVKGALLDDKDEEGDGQGSGTESQNRDPRGLGGQSGWRGGGLGYSNFARWKCVIYSTKVTSSDNESQRENDIEERQRDSDQRSHRKTSA